MTTKTRNRFLAFAAPVGALLFALLVTTVILVATGHNPFEAFGKLFGSFSNDRLMINAVNQASVYYLAAVAVAIGFKMNLFNIGVDGQYRIAAMLAAAFAGGAFMSGLPGPVRIALTILAAGAVGALWAGLAALLRVTRGVSEVISTIMLNAIATAIVSYLLNPQRLAVLEGNNVSTPPITEGGYLPNIDVGSSSQLWTMIFLAMLVGIGYWFLLNRTVFGFTLKVTGMSETAAVASGISVKKMIVLSMLLSGLIAGLVGMPELLNGRSHAYSLNFPAGIGFTGIAVALLGRNSPVGIVFAALLWSWLDQASNVIQEANVPKELVAIMQGVIVFSVVIAYELVRRYRLILEQRDVGRALAASTPVKTVSA